MMQWIFGWPVWLKLFSVTLISILSLGSALRNTFDEFRDYYRAATQFIIFILCMVVLITNLPKFVF